MRQAVLQFVGESMLLAMVATGTAWRTPPQGASVPNWLYLQIQLKQEISMANDQQTQDQATPAPSSQAPKEQDKDARPPATDGLEDKKPEELTQEELRLMADTMPGEGPGDD
jgi:hypothetical protein